MKKIVQLSILLFHFSSLADETKFSSSKIEVNSSSVPHVITLILEHTEEYPTFSGPKWILENLDDLNQALMTKPHQSNKAFFMAQFHKTFFDFSKSDLLDANNIHISGVNILAARQKLKKNQLLYTSLSSFLVQDMLENYTPFLKDDFINNYLNSSQKKYQKPKLRKEIEKLNKHVGPWIILFLRNDSKKFNQICTDFLAQYFYELNYLSKFFKTHAINTEEDYLFRYSKGSISDYILELEKAQKTKNENKQEIQNNPSNDIKNLNIDPGAAASGKIDKIIQKIDQNKK